MHDQLWIFLYDVANQEVTRLMNRLPNQIRVKIQSVPIIFEKKPPPLMLADGVEPDVLGLFVGDDYPHGSSSPVPTEIYIFLLNIWDVACAEVSNYRAEVCKTLLHEWGHYLGLDEKDLFERDL